MNRQDLLKQEIDDAIGAAIHDSVLGFAEAVGDEWLLAAAKAWLKGDVLPPKVAKREVKS